MYYGHLSLNIPKSLKLMLLQMCLCPKLESQSHETYMEISIKVIWFQLTEDIDFVTNNFDF